MKPTYGERFWGALTFKLEILDQADLVPEITTVPSPRDPDTVVTVARFRPAGDEALLKGTLTLNLASLFEDVDSLNSRYVAFQKHQGLFATTGGNPVPAADAFRYFARSRASDRFDRFWSGISLSAGLAERARAVDQPPLPDDDENEGVFNFTFDPAKLAVTDEQVGKAIASVVAYAKAYDDAGALGSLPKCGKTSACFKKLAETSTSRGWMSILPKFEVKSVDQFDFLNINDRFQTSSLLEDSIESYSLTWDLGKTIGAGAAQRRARLANIATLQKLEKQTASSPSVGPVNIKLVGMGHLVSLKLKVENVVGDVAWSIDRLSGAACAGLGKDTNVVFPGISVKGTRLEGYPTLANKSCRFALQAKDEVGRKSDALLCTLATP